MSLVSIFVREKFLTVVSDGRVINTTTGEVTNEKFQKFKSVDEGRRFVACSGIKEIGEFLSKVIQEEIELKNTKLKNVAAELTMKMNQYVGIVDKRVAIAFGGIGNNNEIEVYQYDSITGRLNHYKPNGVEAAFFTMSHGEVSQQEMFELFKKELDLTLAKGDTIDSAIQAQEKLNSYVASKDRTVNNMTFSLGISL